MRALLTNFGTTGDVLPLVALGLELSQVGHDVLLGFSPTHAATILGYGLEFAPVGPDLLDVQKRINQRWIEDESVYASPSEMRSLLAPLEDAIPHTYDDLTTLARNADVIISGPAQPAARMVHEMTGIPFVSVHFSHFGGSGTPGLQAATATLINPFRRKLGLPALANPVTIDANSPQLALYAMSRHLVPRAANAPTHHRVVGFFFLDPYFWTPDPALEAFLSEGEPPVIISFGSMPHADPPRMTAIIEEAVTLAGVRAVLQRGWSGLGGSISTVHVTGFAPHHWLFSRGSCLVHHGGGGTAGAAFRSGRPSVYVPHGTIFDQHYWAQLSRERGCSGEAIAIGALTADTLATRIRETLDNRDRRRAAEELGTLIRAEHGVVTARRAIEKLVSRVGFSGFPMVAPRRVATRTIH